MESAMQLNIKNPEVVRMAHALAAASGKSVTAVVKEALAAEMARQPAQLPDDHQARLDHIMALTAQWRAAQPKPLPTQAELDAWLYDEHGLPK
jgi:hypothetical protein